jgi:hypothetical protein
VRRQIAGVACSALFVVGCGRTAAPAADPTEPITTNISTAVDPSPLADPLLAWLAAPTCPEGTVLVGDRGDDLTCWDVVTTMPHGPSVGWSGGELLVTGSFDRSYQDGTWTWYGPGGSVESQGQWKRGRKVGVWRVWDAEGSLLRTYDLGSDGTGTSEVWSGGVQRARRQYVRGLPTRHVGIARCRWARGVDLHHGQRRWRVRRV